MQSTAYISSTPLRLAEAESDGALQGFVDEFASDHGYFVDLVAEDDGSYRIQMETADVFQEALSEALGRFCEQAGSLLAEPVEILLRVDEMNDDRDRYFYAAADDSELSTFKANCRIERAIQCLGITDVDARAALESFLTAPPASAYPDRPRS